MANRYTLHINKLKAFKEWLQDDGWKLEETKAPYEVLRARKPGKTNPLLLYKKDNAKEHLSVMDRDYCVVRAFLKSKKETSEKRKETKK